MTHTHSYECNHRNGIMLRTRHDDEGVPVFPEDAAPQFDEPYQQVRQSLRVAVNRLQENFANRVEGRPPQRPLLIPAEVGTLPRGRVYHFFPGCHHMRRARVETGGRILRECQICTDMARRNFFANHETTVIPFLFGEQQPVQRTRDFEDYQPDAEEMAVPLNDEQHFPALPPGNMAIEERRVR